MPIREANRRASGEDNLFQYIGEMILATDPKKSITFEEAQPFATKIVTKDFIRRHGRTPDIDEIRSLVATEVWKLFEPGFTESIIVDRIGCTVIRDQYISPENVKRLTRLSQDKYRNYPMFSPEIRKYIDNYVNQQISNVIPPLKKKFTVIHDPISSTKFSIESDSLIINRQQIIEDLFIRSQAQLYDQSRVKSYNFQILRNKIHRAYHANNISPELVAKYKEVYYDLSQVTDYVINLLLNRGFQAGLDITYMYQKLNLYEITCILETLYTSELQQYEIEIHIPIVSRPDYDRIIQEQLVNSGIYTPPGFANTLEDRYYTFLIYAVLLTPHRTFIYPYQPDFKKLGQQPKHVQVQWQQCINSDDMQYIRENISDIRIVLFLELSCKLREYLEYPEHNKPAFNYNKSLDPEENQKNITDPDILNNIQQIMDIKTREIDEFVARNPSPEVLGQNLGQPLFEVIVGPMGSGKSRFKDRIEKSYQGRIYAFEPDSLACMFPDYVPRKHQTINTIKSFYDSRLAIRNKSGVDILQLTLELSLSDYVHMQYINYAWLVYFKLLKIASARNINVLTELTAKSESSFNAVMRYVPQYKKILRVVHIRLDQQYFNQLKRSMVERRIAFRNEIVESTNATYDTLLKLLTNDKYMDIDVFIYENSNYSIDEPDNLLLKRTSGIVTCIRAPDTIPLETGARSLFRAICGYSGSGTNIQFCVLFALLVIVIVVMIYYLSETNLLNRLISGV